MTLEEYQTAIQQRFNRLRDTSWLLPLVTELHSAMTKRIFDDGIMGNGSKIGRYKNGGDITLTGTGSLKLDFARPPVIEGNSIVVKLSGANREKAERLIDRYGETLFSPTQEEENTLVKQATEVVIESLQLA